MNIDPELLDILACPKCRGTLCVRPPGDGLICESCKLLYPIRENIPILLIDEAVPAE